MPKETIKKQKNEKKPENFAFRIKIGEYEVEIKGNHDDVTKTLENLPSLVTNVHKAFENVKPKTITTLTVKTEPTAKTKKCRIAKLFSKNRSVPQSGLVSRNGKEND